MSDGDTYIDPDFNDQDLYDMIRVAKVHASSALKMAKVLRPDLQPLISEAYIRLSAATTSIMLAIPCEACEGKGCSVCRPDEE